MKCPIDRHPLLAKVHDGLQVRACNACGGTWISGSTLEALQREQRSRTRLGVTPAVPTRSRHSRECPACLTELASVRVRGIGLDRCNACRGVWFDSGEINILRRRAQFAPRPELVKSRSQRRRLPRHDGFLGEVAGRVLDAMLQAALEAVGYAVGG